MNAQLSAQLHCGRVNIGHVHCRAAQRVVARSAPTRYCKLSERSHTPLFGNAAALKIAPACQRHPRPSRKASVQTSAMFNFFRGDASEDTRKKYKAQVDAINKLEPAMQELSDQELSAKTVELKQKAQQQSLDDLLVEAFAVVREASKRVLGLRPFDVQLIGGMVLHKGEIAEMRTGEGKTLVAVLPAYLNALSGKGVQVVTVNDYLARRDSEWVGQVHRFLGLQVGLVQTGLDADERRAAYNADITYITNSELGFDYLRDNLAQRDQDLALRDFQYCVIDEVDSILIDEARTPLIISGSAEKPSEKYYKAAKLAAALEKGFHYTVDEKQKSVLLTEEGYEAAEDVLEVQDLYDAKEQWASYVLNALKAKDLQTKDVSYIVRGEEAIIVDEFTGRTMPGRRWGEGLHQAVEAKERLPVQNETVSLASISYQNFFRSYKKLAGMTGTAATESPEFSNIYKLPVTVVPTNRPVKRIDESDVVFKTEQGKWKAVVTEIKRQVKTGRPVLVGTTSVEKSEMLAEMLKQAEIKAQLLNAKPENVERESEIVAQSGRSQAVTIATNMAGRGTDIILGGNSEYMARLKLRELLMPEVVSQVEGSNPNVRMAHKNGGYKTWKVSPDLFPCDLSEDVQRQASEAVKAAVGAWGQRALLELEAEERLSVACEKSPSEDPVINQLRQVFKAMEEEYKGYTAQDKEKVVSAGGLMVVGTERHESRRIDNQLRGRSGRQGDPGSTRYFLSLEDSLFRVFGGERIQNLMTTLGVGDLPIESKILTRSLDEAQRKVESYYFDLRKRLFEYDQVMNTQRDKVYGERRRALQASDLSTQMVEYAEKTVDDIIEANIAPEAPPAEWRLEMLAGKMQQYCPRLTDLNGEVLRQQSDGDFEQLRDYMRRRAVEAYWQKVEEVNNVEAGLMQHAQRFFVLTQTDNLWKEHLQAIKFLQQAVGLRGYAQRDPLTEYKLEGYNLFLEMMANIRRNTIYNIYVFSVDQAAQSRQQQYLLQQQQRELQKLSGQQQRTTAKDAISDVAAATPESSKDAMMNEAASDASNGNGGPLNNGSSKQGSRSKTSKQKVKAKR